MSHRVKEKRAGRGRNDLCPCGSEKKYKECCGEKLFVRKVVYPDIPAVEVASPQPSGKISPEMAFMVMASAYGMSKRLARSVNR